jgi:hypothetical protein
MQYANNQHKFVAVLNKRIELPKLLNALGHISAGLVSLLPPGTAHFLTYADADGGIHPAISEFPFIVLQADNSNQLRTLRRRAIEQQITYNDFTESMLGTSATAQRQQTAASPEESLQYFAVVLFGEANVLTPLTKRFSLMR